VAHPLSTQVKVLQQLEHVPLAERARAAILQAILEDQFEGRLPSEDVLAEMLNVSRTTVRAAVQDLERDGIVTRRRAIGTRINRHVSPATLALQRLVGFDYLLAEKGYDVATEISWKKREVTPKLLPLPWQETMVCCVIEKEYYAGGGLAIYLRDYVPWDSLKDTDFDEPLMPSLFEFSKRYCTTPIDHAVATIVPMAATAKRDDVTRLELKAGTPFIRLHETHYSDQAAVVAFSYIDIDDAFLQLEVFRGQ
jgi:GntR family transcriptional regulator